MVFVSSFSRRKKIPEIVVCVPGGEDPGEVLQLGPLLLQLDQDPDITCQEILRTVRKKLLLKIYIYIINKYLLECIAGTSPCPFPPP